MNHQRVDGPEIQCYVIQGVVGNGKDIHICVFPQIAETVCHLGLHTSCQQGRVGRGGRIDLVDNVAMLIQGKCQMGGDATRSNKRDFH